MSILNYNFNSSGYQSFFDLDNTPNVTDLFQGENELIPCEHGEIGFSDSEIRELAEEISDKLILLVKKQLES